MKNVGRAAREGRQNEALAAAVGKQSKTAESLADTVRRQQRAADEQDRRAREQSARQSATITRFVEFLQERNLMDEFNAWASKREQQTDGN